MGDADAQALNEFQKANQRPETCGTSFVYRTAKEPGVTIALGTGVPFVSALADRVGVILAKLPR